METKKFLELVIALFSLVLFFSCEKSCPTDGTLNLSSCGDIEAMESFSTALSMAVHKNQEVRDLIKQEALGRFDNDYDVLYQNIKYAKVSESMSFRDVLISYMESPEEMDKIERLVPELTIYVSDVTWLDPQGFCAENWDTTDDCIAVTYKSPDGFCEKLFAGGCLVGEIDPGTIPGGPVLIVKKNERIVANVSTKAGGFQYSFIDDVFNGKHHASTRINRHSGKYSTSVM